MSYEVEYGSIEKIMQRRYMPNMFEDKLGGFQVENFQGVGDLANDSMIGDLGLMTAGSPLLVRQAEPPTPEEARVWP